MIWTKRQVTFTDDGLECLASLPGLQKLCLSQLAGISDRGVGFCQIPGTADGHCQFIAVRNCQMTGWRIFVTLRRSKNWI